MSNREDESNLIVVATAEEYGFRHNMETKDVLKLFSENNIFALLRSQYDVLHTLDLSEGADFAESYLERERQAGNGLSEKYVYHGMDITLDVYEKLKSVVEMISEKENQSFDESYIAFSSSRTYRSLQIPDSMMWSESTEYIVDDYYRELA